MVAWVVSTPDATISRAMAASFSPESLSSAMRSFRSVTNHNLIRPRTIVHTCAIDFLRHGGLDRDYAPMTKRKNNDSGIEQLIKEAAQPYQSVWWDDDRLNFEALARFFEKRGRKIPSATLYRICKGVHKPSERIVEAINHVLLIPKELVRGEALSEEMSKTFGDYRLSTLILAEKLESLPRADYARIVEQIDATLDRERRLKEAMGTDGKITHIDRHRR